MKRVIIIFICIIVLILLFLLIYNIIFEINKSRFENLQDPILCFNIMVANDGGTTIYSYPTYKIIKYKNTFNDKEIFVMGDSNLEYNNPFYDKNSSYYIPQK